LDGVRRKWWVSLRRDRTRLGWDGMARSRFAHRFGWRWGTDPSDRNPESNGPNGSPPCRPVVPVARGATIGDGFSSSVRFGLAIDMIHRTTPAESMLEENPSPMVAVTTQTDPPPRHGSE
jgi:hypothetical protein